MSFGRMGMGRLGRMGAGSGHGTVLSTTTWDTNHQSASVSVTNGNLTITGTLAVTYAGIRSVASASSGKKYWELTIGSVTSAASVPQGIANGSFTFASYVGSDANSGGAAGDGTVYGLTGGPLSTWTSGSVIGIALDIDNNKIWWRTGAGNWNNDVSANPATNTNGISTSGITGPFFAVGSLRDAPDTITANFGGSAYANAAPAGFGNW